MSSVNGINIQLLHGTETAKKTSPLQKQQDVLNVVLAYDLQGIGLGSANDDLTKLKNYLVTVRNTMANNPELVANVVNPADYVKMLDFAIKNWDNEQTRDKALEKLEQIEDELFKRFPQLEETLSGFDDEGFGRLFKRVRNAVKNVANKAGDAVKKVANNVADAAKDTAKKAGEIGQKAIDAVVKYTPITAAARLGLLKAIELNLFQMATKLSYGLLTQEQALQQGLTLQQWEKAKEAYQKSENLHRATLKGDANKFREAVIKGKDKRGKDGAELNGFMSGLGEPVAAATGTAAATTFIAKIVDWLKAIGPVAQNANQLINKNQNSQQQPDQTKINDALQRINQVSNAVNNFQRLVTPGNVNNNPQNSNQAPAPQSAELPSSQNQNKNMSNLPESQNLGIGAKVVGYIKENPIKSAVIGTVAVTGIALAVSPKLRAKVFGKKQPQQNALPQSPQGFSGTKSRKKSSKKSSKNRSKYKTIKI